MKHETIGIDLHFSTYPSACKYTTQVSAIPPLRSTLCLGRSMPQPPLRSTLCLGQVVPRPAPLEQFLIDFIDFNTFWAWACCWGRRQQNLLLETALVVPRPPPPEQFLRGGIALTCVLYLHADGYVEKCSSMPSVSCFMLQYYQCLY